MELGTIKISDGKIITKKEGVTQIWTQSGGDPNFFIVFRGLVYRLFATK